MEVKVAKLLPETPIQALGEWYDVLCRETGLQWVIIEYEANRILSLRSEPYWFNVLHSEGVIKIWFYIPCLEVENAAISAIHTRVETVYKTDSDLINLCHRFLAVVQEWDVQQELLPC